jgi:hypothetical protein
MSEWTLPDAPSLADVARAHPSWTVLRGRTELFYASKGRASLSARTPAGLREAILVWERQHEDH